MIGYLISQVIEEWIVDYNHFDLHNSTQLRLI